MGVLFESILLFSLAVLIILMGLLVYYFKKRIVEVEQKNESCLEIVQDVYTQHMKLRNDVYSLMIADQHQQQPEQHQHHYYNTQEQRDDRIKIVLSEEDESDDDDDAGDVSDESDASDDSEDDESIDEKKRDINDIDYDDDLKQETEKIKVVSVDLTFDEEVEINVDDEESEEETELKSLQPIDAPIVVNKVDAPPITKEDLKKLTPSALKALLTGKGVPADQVSKMKKNDLIEKLLQENV